MFSFRSFSSNQDLVDVIKPRDSFTYFTINRKKFISRNFLFQFRWITSRKTNDLLRQVKRLTRNLRNFQRLMIRNVIFFLQAKKASHFLIKTTNNKSRIDVVTPQPIQCTYNFSKKEIQMEDKMEGRKSARGRVEETTSGNGSRHLLPSPINSQPNRPRHLLRVFRLTNVCPHSFYSPFRHVDAFADAAIHAFLVE